MAEVKYEVHPSAKVFPLLPKAEFKALKDDIKARGIRQPILRKGNIILDGRNRLAAAEELGLKPSEIPFEEYQGGDETGEIIANNILRRHLTDDMRVGIVAKLRGEELSKQAKADQTAKLGKGGKKQTKGKGEAADRVAKEAKVSQHKGRAALKAAKHAPEELDKVIEGKAKLAAAKKAADAKVGKTAKPKAEKPLADRVKAKFIRFMDGFPITEHREVRAILRDLLKVDGAIKTSGKNNK